MSNADIIAFRLGGRRNGHGWLVRCPAHDDHNPSLSIADGDGGRLLVKCWAGCDPLAVLLALRELKLPIENCRPQDFDKKLRDFDTRYRGCPEYLIILDRTLPIRKGTPAEAYLRKRGFTGRIPPTLRFLPRHIHTPSGQSFPAIIAIINREGTDLPVAIHRIYLKQNGRGKAPVEPPKMSFGQVRSGAVRLSKAGKVLAVTEGIETGLSILQATKIPTWAALSTSGLTNLILPPLPLASEVIICADNDRAGRLAAEKAAAYWLAEGRKVRIAKPPKEKTDFNDLLKEKK